MSDKIIKYLEKGTGENLVNMKQTKVYQADY